MISKFIVGYFNLTLDLQSSISIFVAALIAVAAAVQLSLVLLLGDVNIHAETFTLHTRRFMKNIYKMHGKKQ